MSTSPLDAAVVAHVRATLSTMDAQIVAAAVTATEQMNQAVKAATSSWLPPVVIGADSPEVRATIVTMVDRAIHSHTRGTSADPK